MWSVLGREASIKLDLAELSTITVPTHAGFVPQSAAGTIWTIQRTAGNHLKANQRPCTLVHNRVGW
jgi:hypothetical protein